MLQHPAHDPIGTPTDSKGLCEVLYTGASYVTLCVERMLTRTVPCMQQGLVQDWSSWYSTMKQSLCGSQRPCVVGEGCF